MFAFRSILETSGRCHTPIAWALCRDELSDELFYAGFDEAAAGLGDYLSAIRQVSRSDRVKNELFPWS